jgi:hypothetical protein
MQINGISSNLPSTPTPVPPQAGADGQPVQVQDQNQNQRAGHMRGHHKGGHGHHHKHGAEAAPTGQGADPKDTVDISDAAKLLNEQAADSPE